MEKLFTTQPWIKSRSFENDEIDRLNDRFDILQNKKKTPLIYFFYGAVWTDKMKISPQIFQNYFPLLFL
jgi:hypothetical protein